MSFAETFLKTVTDSRAASNSLKVAAVIGTVLLTINHGPALIGGTMSRDRWISAGLTYIVPFLVSIHGQAMSQSQQQENRRVKRRAQKV